MIHKFYFYDGEVREVFTNGDEIDSSQFGRIVWHSRVSDEDVVIEHIALLYSGMLEKNPKSEAYTFFTALGDLVESKSPLQFIEDIVRGI